MFINCGFISYVSLLLFFTLCLKFILVFFQKVSQVLWGPRQRLLSVTTDNNVFLIIIVYILFTVLLLFHTPKEGTY